MQSQKESRATTSCTECQRRKQKCSREWPCNHCQARKVPHLCQFSVKKPQQESSPESARESSATDSRGLKRSAPDSAEPSFPSQNSEGEEPEDGLKAWGYMPGHVHYKVGTVDETGARKDSPSETNLSDVVDKVLHVLPPRSITDAFVNHFLNSVNYRYNAIYGPTLAEQYVQWWADRGVGNRLSPEFTCLLLRICAYSVQYLTAELRKMVEFELAVTSQTLTEQFASAADQLSQSFEASNTTIERVQEQFLKGAWLKSESKIVDSWHALSRTIREAQELGIDKDAGIETLCEFDIEMRRRLWALLYIWDWQMSSWLGRPNLIDQKNLNFKLPVLRLDQSTTNPNVLSPFAHMALQAELGLRVTAKTGDTESGANLSARQVLAFEAECEKFIDELPPIFRVKHPDTSLDDAHPHFVFQRHQLHCVIFLTMMNCLKPYLTRERHDKMTNQDDEFRKMGVDIALRLLDVARNLFDHEFPINAKFHMCVFAIFDTATLLCSAIIHDREHVLPHREDVISAINNALEMLHQLSLTTKLGATSYNFLFKLIQATPELSRHSPRAKRQRQTQSHSSSSVPTTSPPDSIPLSTPYTNTTTTPPLPAPASSNLGLSSATLNSLPQSQTQPQQPLPLPDDLAFDIEQFLAQNPFGGVGDPAALDMGGMEQVWDWEDLRIDMQGGGNNGANGSTAG